MEMGYLTVLHVSLGAKFGDLHAKDSHSFCNRLILIHFVLGVSHARRLSHIDQALHNRIWLQGGGNMHTTPYIPQILPRASEIL